MVTERRACKKIVKLLDDNNKLRSIDKSRSETPATQNKLLEMQSMLATSFQLWPANVDSLMNNDEDLAFLQSMKTDRAASFGVFDKALAQKINRRHCRDVAALGRLKRARGEIEASTKTVLPEVVTDECSDESSESASEDDMESEFRSPSKEMELQKPNRIKPKGTLSFIPPDLLSH
jgi:hypothetical protein